ncbi:MAG: CHAD domain-containing protein [Alphaproteobacteria bacterium]|nr:CHAD domain-containing protein [Alphaproteobacteria bacterium]
MVDLKRRIERQGEQLAILRRARSLLDGLFTDLAAAAVGAEVHGARRRIKRLRSLVRLLKTAIGKSQSDSADRALKKAADALAAPRRAEALSAALAKIEAGLPKNHGLKVLLNAYLTRHADQDALAVSIERALAAVEGIRAEFDSWRLNDDAARPIAKAFANTYRKARKDLRAAAKSGKAEALHDARKLVIHHLHHLELLGNILNREPTDRIDALNRLRELLGDINDLDELEALAKSQNLALPPQVTQALRQRKAALVRKVRKAWRPLFETRTKPFVKCIVAM